MRSQTEIRFRPREPESLNESLAPLPVIDHPASQPLYYRIEPDLHLPERRQCGLLLRFHSRRPLFRGTRLELRVPIADQVHTFHGEIVRGWEGEHAPRVQVWINHREEFFAVRMVEQLCHIAHYRQNIERREGRAISDEEAANEWISRFASAFAQS